MQGLRLGLFGIPALLGSAGDEPLLPERLTQLAVVLAARGNWVTRDQLIALLWPELDGEAARRNLRKLVFRARRQPWFDGLETRTDALRWRVDSDLRDFDSACTQQDWTRAATAYGGTFCNGFEHKAAEPFVEWLRFERNHLAAAYRSAVAQRLQQLSADAAQREQVARHWLALDPLDEDALAATVEAVAAQGRHGEVRRAVEQFRSGWRKKSVWPRQHACVRCSTKRPALRRRRGSPTRASRGLLVVVPNYVRPRRCCCATNAVC